ncbi:MAG: excinuclease ABC subunit UvrC [Candidatus Jidaibacter sp.]|jgi:excinuclease ABC subunit C|nr:excinuclease ABC subunit UvrC [Candidatus Jidaibacter sp.]
MKQFNIQHGVEIIRHVSGSMPNSPGVYKMIDAADKILYIGKAKLLPKRVSSYANYGKLSNRLKRMIAQIRKIEYIITNSEAEALLLEANLIKNVKPPYNICLRDDKSFPYILFEESHEFPRITKYRGNKAAKGAYFGPFASASQVKIAMVELQKIFQIRPCSDAYFASRTRPCLEYEIKRCSAPCVKKIDTQDYAKLVSLAKDFLNGKSNLVHKRLQEIMDTASNELDYEKAAQVRDRIKILNSIQAKNNFADLQSSDVDLVVVAKKRDVACIQIYFIRGGKNYGNKSYYNDNATEFTENEILELFLGQFYQTNAPPKLVVVSHPCEAAKSLEELLTQKSGEKIKIIANPTKQHLKDLVEFGIGNASASLDKFLKERIKHTESLIHVAKLFSISRPIKRVEVYDNSHISGTNAVGCMVVYTENGFDKNQYRKFTIQSTQEPDDYEMLREVLTRRLKRLNDDNYPDLMLIDGGKGHLSVALEVLEKLGHTELNLVCISKGPDRNAGREFFHTKDGRSFQLDLRDPTLKFLQILRDEVHRYAIKSHRDKRSKELRKSSLDVVPGIGRKRKITLLKHFGSFESIMEASAADLSRVEGISRLTAEKIFNYLHNISYN